MSERPSALYLAASIDTGHPDRSGWVELDYGDGGNVTALTVHGQCSGGVDIGGSDIEARRDHLRAVVTCLSDQHYQYRWDELNRISEARRFDRAGGRDTAWSFAARQRYRYDGGNVRVIKQSFDTSTGIGASDGRVALYVYPGDFERRGLELDGGDLTYAPIIEAAASTETQYLVAGARMVWDHDAARTAGTDLDQNRRITLPVSDLLHTTSASVDLLSGELLEVSTYYPNGARETLLVEDGGEESELPATPLEPMGFTAKEADEDVGLVYFGERYLVARVGRWASPDPLAIHAAGGGQELNAFHYASGNLLQARDPIGLDVHFYVPDAQSAPDLQDRLYQAGLRMTQQMSSELRSQWGISTHVESNEDGRAVYLRVDDDQEAAINAAADAVRAQAAAEATGSNGEGPSDDARAAAGQAAVDRWLSTRQYMMDYLTGHDALGRDRQVVLTTVSENGQPLQTSEPSGHPLAEHILANPFAWWAQSDDGNWLRQGWGTPGMSLAFGPTEQVFLHEPSHIFGCADGGSGCGGLGNPGGVPGPSEYATTRAVDNATRDAVGHPQRYNYNPDPGVGTHGGQIYSHGSEHFEESSDFTQSTGIALPEIGADAPAEGE